MLLSSKASRAPKEKNRSELNRSMQEYNVLQEIQLETGTIERELCVPNARASLIECKKKRTIREQNKNECIGTSDQCLTIKSKSDTKTLYNEGVSDANIYEGSSNAESTGIYIHYMLEYIDCCQGLRMQVITDIFRVSISQTLLYLNLESVGEWFLKQQRMKR